MTWMGDPNAEAFLRAVAASQSGMDPTTAKIMQNYGYLAGFLTHPEIGPLLREAAEKGWSKEILQGRLYQTAWWKEHQAAARELDVLRTTDPATYNEKVNAKAREVRQIATAAGIQFQDWNAITMVAVALLQNPSLTPQQQQAMIYSQAQYKPDQGGGLGYSMDQIQARAADFLYPVSDQAAFTWAKRIGMGNATIEGFDAHMRNLAKSRFGHFADQIDAGSTLKDIFDPYVQQTAQLLELSPESIDMMDPTFLKMVESRDPKTNQLRAMSLSEAGEYIRRSAAYDKTQGAMNRAAEFAENLLRTFGAVKA